MKERGTERKRRGKGSYYDRKRDRGRKKEIERKGDMKSKRDGRKR